MLVPFMFAGEVIQILGPQQARIQSRSTAGVWYALTATSCSCRGWEIRKRCRHLEAWKRFLASGTVNIQEDDLAEAFPSKEGATA